MYRHIQPFMLILLNKTFHCWKETLLTTSEKTSLLFITFLLFPCLICFFFLSPSLYLEWTVSVVVTVWFMLAQELIHTRALQAYFLLWRKKFKFIYHSERRSFLPYYFKLIDKLSRHALSDVDYVEERESLQKIKTSVVGV